MPDLSGKLAKISELWNIHQVLAHPTQKIIRICTDENTGGAGIHLNDSSSWKEYYAPYTALDVYFREGLSSDITKDYTV